MPRLRYRTATPKDMDRVVDLLCLAYAIEEPGVRPIMLRRARPEDTRLVCDGDELVAAGRLLALDVAWNGRTVGLGGVASLGVPPDRRRRGHVSRLLLDMLGEMRERGMALSGLYPFDAGFYRRYGWALASAPVTVKLPVRKLTTRDRLPGRVERFDAARAAELRALHAIWARRHNLGVVRSAWWYEHYVARTYYGPTPHVYRYVAPGGAAEGYVLFSYVRPEYRSPVVVREIVHTTPRARAALLAFLGDQDSQTQELELRLPPSDPLVAQLGSYEGCRVSTELDHMAMIRVVDVRAALSGWTNLAGDDAEVVIELDDEHARWNRGRFAIAIRGGASSIAATKRRPDLTLSIHTLTQLVTGFLDPTAAFDAQLLDGRAVERAEVLARFAGGLPPYHGDSY